MTLTLQVPDDVATRLEVEAKRRGVMVDECLVQIVEERLPSARASNALSDMFAQWNREDATGDPAEMAVRRAEWEELKRNMNANRGSQRKLFTEQDQ